VALLTELTLSTLLAGYLANAPHLMIAAESSNRQQTLTRLRGLIMNKLQEL
jgi:hypothetical protein